MAAFGLAHQHDGLVYKKRFGRNPEPYAAESFDATLVGLQAIKAAIEDSQGRQLTRLSVAREVRRVRAFQGITGTIEFDDKGDRRAAHYFVIEVEAKKPEDWGRNRLVMQLELPPSP
jgi:branched-chain amino acid transport system substrate-binding protein